MGDDKSLLALDTLRDIYALPINNIKLSEEQFPTYHMFEFHVGDKILVRNHIRDVLDAKYDFVYYVVHLIG